MLFDKLKSDISYTLQALFIILFICFVFLYASLRARQTPPRLTLDEKASSFQTTNDFPCTLDAQDSAIEAPIEPLEKERHDYAELEELQLYKNLFFKVQNLEEHPEILPHARNVLISLFSETLAVACRKRNQGILSVRSFSREALANFLKKDDDETYTQWENYLARRKTGQPTELFDGRMNAEWWVRQLAPVKYVDGAWLGHINRVTTPYALRRIVKDAWQVLSEELGDGDLEKNHVHLYHKLVSSIEPALPCGDDVDFIHSRHGMNQTQVWKAAVGQLLISLFPHEFLPEILGFNMQFEGITLQTLKASTELKEAKLDPYYFILHISIDNADSGHTAMAMQTVVNYVEHIQKTEGYAAGEQAWKRVQAGFILSSGLPSDMAGPRPTEPDTFPRNEQEAGVIKLFQAKALVAGKIHCSSRVRIGSRTLADWLEAGALTSKEGQMRFLDELADSKPWIRKGDSNGSRLMRELSWGGKMFGSFTQDEVIIVRQWIESLGKPKYDPRFYWSFVERPEITSDDILRDQDIRVNYPAFSPQLDADLSNQAMPSMSDPPLSISALTLTIKQASRPIVAKLFPLWFTHTCLLESFICVPSKTTNLTASAVLRLLRAQSGFGVEGSGVAGMDEVRRTESVGIVELGMEMLRRYGLSKPTCLRDVLDQWHSEFALLMLHSSMSPMRNAGLLLGLAYAFVGLHDLIAGTTTSPPSSAPLHQHTPSLLLSTSSAETLRQIARRERDSLDICLEELIKGGDQLQYQHFCRGFLLGKSEIEDCFVDAADETLLSSSSSHSASIHNLIAPTAKYSSCQQAPSLQSSD